MRNRHKADNKRKGSHYRNAVAPIYKGSKNISTKMLKDVGMTVPKSRETSAVDSYMQQDRG